MQGWISYFKDVLGVRDILLPAFDLPVAVEPESEASALLKKIQAARVIFLAEKGSLDGAGFELLQKMMAAMKLPDGDVTFQEVVLTEIIQELYWLEQRPAVIVFSDSFFGFLSSQSSRMKVLRSPSPAEMLANPTLKRDAWELLKSVMKNLERKDS